MRSSMTAKQAFAWAFCALCVPVMVTCAARPWPEVLLAGALVSLIYIIMYKRLSLPLTEIYPAAFGKIGSAALFLTGLWMLLAAADMLVRSGAIYGDAPQATYCAPAIVLLAAWCCVHPGSGAKCAAVLAPVLAVGFGAFLLSALPQIRPSWISFDLRAGESAQSFAVLLLPTALFFLPQGRAKRRPFWLLTVVPPAVSAVCVGCLGIEVASAEPFAFFTLSQSVSLFAAVERFEPIVSALSFGAFFALETLLLSGAAAIFRKLLPKFSPKRLPVLCAAAAFFAMPAARRLPLLVFVLSGVIFWGFLPLGTLLLVAAKKDEKNVKKVVDKGLER